MTTYKEFLLENEEKLDMCTKAISKVDSRLHPEVHAVRAFYEELLGAVKNDDEASALTPTFDRLVEVTSDFEIPSDTCETFTGAYQDLEAANALSRAETVP